MTARATLVVTLAVAVLALVALAGIIALAWAGQPVPDVLQNVAVGSLTGLVGLLVPSPDRRSDSRRLS